MRGDEASVRDSRFHREVAIKILSQRLAADEAARTRFLREARIAARLDHPNICAAGGRLRRPVPVIMTVTLNFSLK